MFSNHLLLCSSLAVAFALHPVYAQTEQLPEVVVTGKTSPLVPQTSQSGTKTDTPLLQTPQSISSVSREEIKLRGAQSVTESLAYTPGVMTGVGGEDSRVDDVFIRGFDASGFSTNVYQDGLRAASGGQWTRSQFDVFGLERVEVVKGPASVLYGQTAPGGLLNVVSKRPQAQSEHEIGLQYNSLEQFQVTLDSTGALDDKQKVLYRLVGLYREGDAQIDFTDLERIFLAPSITFNIGDSTTWTFYAQYQKDEGGSSYQFLPTVGTLYATPFGRIDRETFLGEPEFNTFNREQLAIGYEFKHSFNEHLSIHQNLRYTHIDTEYEGVVADRAGTLADGRTLRRRAVRGVGDVQSFAIDTHLNATFNTGPLSHQVTLGWDYLESQWNHERTGTNSVTPIDIFNPVYSGRQGITDTLRPQVITESETHMTGLYLQEHLSFQGFHLLLSGRYDWTEEETLNGITGLTSVTDAEKFTGRVGLLYEFDSGLAPYVSYATSFEPVSGFNAQGNRFQPTEGEQIELGIKYQPKNFNALFTLSLFQLTQSNVLTTDLNDPLFQVQTGEIEIRGLEFETKVQLAKGLTLIGGWTLFDSEITQDNAGLQGNRFAAVPDQIATLWLDYTFADGPLTGLGLGAGVRYIGHRYGDNANQFYLPSQTLFDAGVRYDMSHAFPALKGAKLYLNVSNLADQTYVAKAETVSSANYAPGRVVNFGLTYTW